MPVCVAFDSEGVNDSRTEAGIVAADDLTRPQVAFFGLAELCSVRRLPPSRPHHRQLFTQRKVATRDVNKLDKFTNTPASKAGIKNSGDLPSRVICHPMPGD